LPQNSSIIKGYERLQRLLIQEETTVIENTRQTNYLSNIQIPLDPQLFYEDFGLLIHPKTNKYVLKLTDYQYRIWNNSNKS
jgi:hypothetical protein